MATHRKIPLFLAALLVMVVAQANAQGQPNVSGGSAIRRVELPLSPAARDGQVRDPFRWLRWSAPRWLPGRSPSGGSFTVQAVRPERRDWWRGRLP